MRKKNKKNISKPEMDLFSIPQEGMITSSACLYMSTNIAINSLNCIVKDHNGEFHEKNEDDNTTTVRIINLGEYRRKEVINFVLNNTKSF